MPWNCTIGDWLLNSLSNWNSHPNVLFLVFIWISASTIACIILSSHHFKVSGRKHLFNPYRIKTRLNKCFISLWIPHKAIIARSLDIMWTIVGRKISQGKDLPGVYIFLLVYSWTSIFSVGNNLSNSSFSKATYPIFRIQGSFSIRWSWTGRK